MSDNKFSISNGVLTGYSGNDEEVIIPENVTKIDSMAFFAKSELKKVVIHGGVKVIGQGAFFSCIALSLVILSNGVETIETFAFRNCDSLKEITIPDSVTDIQPMAFEEDVNIKRGSDSVQQPEQASASVQQETNNSSLQADTEEESPYKDFSFEEVDGGYEITKYLGTNSNVVIPSFYNSKPVVSIGKSAFADVQTTRDGDDIKTTYNKSSTISRVVLPKMCTEIKTGAFSVCVALNQVVFNESLKTIGDIAFCGCDSLNNITIPGSVTSIGTGAFWDCSSLNTITIPDSVTSIVDHSFYGCSSLNSITIPDSVTEIEKWAFAKCTSLENITIPDSVTSIGEYAFNECSSLSGITIPDSVTSIEEAAFSKCTSLNSITIPDSVTSITDHAFQECSLLESIKIPDSVTSIGKVAFYGCSSLNSITIPDSVTNIDVFAFYGCKMMSVVIPPSVSYIGDKAFGFLEENDEERYYNDFTVYGKAGTAAEKYAKDNGFKFDDNDYMLNHNVFLGDQENNEGGVNSKCTLYVEDTCELPGRGMVVTGVVNGDLLINGQEVSWTINGQTKKAVIVGIEMGKKLYNAVRRGDAVGLLLNGVKAEEIAVGCILNAITKI